MIALHHNIIFNIIDSFWPSEKPIKIYIIMSLQYVFLLHE